MTVRTIADAYIKPVEKKSYDYSKRIPETMSDSEIRNKLCFGVPGGCGKCVNIKVCLYGQEAIRRNLTYDSTRRY